MPQAPLPRGIWNVVAVAAIGSLMAQLDATIVNVSLASLAADFKTNLATIQWVMSAYLLALALVLPLSGWLVDRIGARSLYLWCFASFTASSALCGFAWSSGSLIAFRVLQGLSGGLLAPMAQMMIARAAGAQMARVAGVATIPILLGPLLGPVLAGAILHVASWRWLFLVNVPLGALAFALAVAVLPDDRGDARPRSLDLIGLGLLSPAMVLLLYGVERPGSGAGLGALAMAIGMFALYGLSARRKGRAALIDLGLLRGRTFSAAMVTMFMGNGVMFTGQMLVPIYLRQVGGFSPSTIGWLLAPLGFGMMCTFPFLGRLTDRFGIRKLAVAGALLSLAGTLCLMVLARSGLNLALLEGCLLLRGIGSGGIGIPAMTAAYASVAREDLPMATTAMNITQRLGGPTCTTLCAGILTWRLSASTPTAAFAVAFALLGALHAVLMLVALRLPWTTPAREERRAA